MNKDTVFTSVIDDLKTSKKTDNIQDLKTNLHLYSIEDLNHLIDEIDNNFYFGQHGVNDITWFNLKKTIKEAINLNQIKKD